MLRVSASAPRSFSRQGYVRSTLRYESTLHGGLTACMTVGRQCARMAMLNVWLFVPLGRAA